ncbi:helix-turn-helix domain-containing protein [Salmonella enterica]|nr:helix-turn-helix domain-containing protein [Salmonella enterica]
MNDKIRSKLMNHFTQAELGRVFNISQPAARKWLHSSLPPGRVIPLSEKMGWEITPHELRPDLYPNPTDGLPPEIQATVNQRREVDL